jgi:hypothetical protein
VLRTLLICGLLAGLCGGLVGAGFAKIAGEPPLDRAVAWESAQAAARGEAPHDEVVSRTVQSGIGLVAGASVYGVALGGLFALVFAGVFGRISRAGPVRTALGLGAAAFVVIYFVPFLKYPPNPPSVGDPATIGDRTALYFGMVAISVLTAIAAVRVRAALAPRLGRDAATLCAVGAFVAVATAAALVMPGVQEVPATFPATTLWAFREAALGVQAVMWTTIALVFGVAAARVIERSSLRSSPAAAARAG